MSSSATLDAYINVVDDKLRGENDNKTIGCDLQRKRIECAIMIKAALAND